MPEQHGSFLTSCLLGLLEMFDEDTPLQPSAEAQSDFLVRLPSASDADIQAILHALWLLMRHVSCADSWENLPPEGLTSPCVRPEIKAHRQQHAAAAPHLEGFRAALAGLQDWQDRVATPLSEATATLCDGRPECHLPTLSANTIPIAFRYDFVRAIRLHDRAFGFLSEITRAIERGHGRSLLFWAVLGPVYDALHKDTPAGYQSTIDDARSRIASERIRSPHADLYDWWYLFTREPHPREQRRIASGLLKHAEHLSDAADLEDFLVHGLSEDDELFERQMPDPDALWQKALRKADLSRRLLARAGFYYFESSPQHRGPALALAAFALCYADRDPDYWGSPFEPLWAAARDAAATGQWELAIDCFNRALLYIEGSGIANDHSYWTADITRFNLETAFVSDLIERFRDDQDRSPVLFLWRALSRLKSATYPEDSRLIKTLTRAAQLCRVEHLDRVIRLELVLGPELWQTIDGKTRELLQLAEAHWDLVESDHFHTDDYSAVGLHFRRAIEHEWRSKLGSHLAHIAQSDTLGGMLRAARDMGVFAKKLLAGSIGHENPLFDHRFLSQAIRVCDTLLNAAAHAEGLERSECIRLRQELLENGLLKRFLLAATPGPKPRKP